MSTRNEPGEDLQIRAARILRAMDDTSIPAMDALFYAHYAQELRLLVEEFLDQPAPAGSASSDRVWLLWNCTDLAGAYTTEGDVHESRADLQHQILCAYGPDPALLESVTISTAFLENAAPTSPGSRR